MSTSNIIIGKKLKSSREYLNFSMEYASQKVGLDASVLSDAEQGEINIEKSLLIQLAKLYKRPSSFFTQDDYSIPQDPNAKLLGRNAEKYTQNDIEELQEFRNFLAMQPRNS